MSVNLLLRWKTVPMCFSANIESSLSRCFDGLLFVLVFFLVFFVCVCAYLKLFKGHLYCALQSL